MIPLKVLLAAVPLLHPVADREAVGCRHYKPFNTEISVKVHVLDNIYEYTVPRKLLTQSREKASKEWQAKQTDMAWATGDLTVEGLAGGATRVTTSSSFIGKPYDRYGQYYCPYIENLDINFYYNTMIFIAREHEKETCNFKAILEHEHKHHDANVMALQEAVDRLHQDLPYIIAEMEGRYVSRNEVQIGFDNLKEGLRDAVRIYGKYASELMTSHNEVIDVPEEYGRVIAQCPR